MKIGLDWTDLDERAATLTIKRAFVRGQRATPKNHQSRVVDVSPQLLRALVVYRRALRAFALGKGRPAPTIMFPAVGGVERLDDSNVRKVFTRMCTAANLRSYSPHDLRDTYASQLLWSNVPLLYVSQQLGHRSAAVTLKHYAKWLPKPNARYVHVLDWESIGSQTADTDPAHESEVIGLAKDFVVSRIFASWNQLDWCLRQIGTLRRVAKARRRRVSDPARRASRCCLSAP